MPCGKTMTTIVWFRQDLRLTDNPALHQAVLAGDPVIPVYIWDPAPVWAPGAASRYWLHQSLTALAESLAQRGAKLILRQGPSAAVLTALIAETGAQAVYWNRRYEPAHIAADEQVKKTLSERVRVQSFNGRLLLEPFKLTTQAGGAYKVFTPFWRRYQAELPAQVPLPAPHELVPPQQWPMSLPLAALGLEPGHAWAQGLHEAWQFGETAAQAMMQDFVAAALEGYPLTRDYPGVTGVSRLSPYLHFGELSPRQLWYEVHQAAIGNGALAPTETATQWLRQLVWREFAYHLLFHFPETAEQPLRSEFASVPWLDDAAALNCWQRGRTGYPIVDAGMRELWRTGWMHNRVRMIVASFLTKHLGIHWLTGARWFWDTLVDADLANNTLGWQWTAGCGADAAPYCRIFNPIAQGQRFDADGAYVKRWVPELARLSPKVIHAPWLASARELEQAGVRLGSDYPHPIVEHQAARVAALARLKAR